MALFTTFIRACRGFSLQSIVVGFVVLVCAAMIGTVAMQICEEKESEIARSRSDTENLTRSLSQHVQDTIRAVDTSLIELVERLENEGTDPVTRQRLHGVMADVVAHLPALKMIGAFDETGTRIGNSAEANPIAVSVATRAYFQFHKFHETHDFRIEMPIRSTATGRWIIPVTRRFNHADGSFGGIVLATLDVDYFETFYGTFGIGKLGVITLVSDNGQVMVHYPVTEAASNTNLSRGPLFEKLLPRSNSGSFSYKSQIDGIERLSSYRKIEDYPLVIVTALSRSEVLAGWAERSRSRSIAVLFEVAVIGVLGFLLARHVRRSAKAEAEVARIAQDYRLMADNSSDIIFRLDMDGVRQYISPACREVLGYEPAQLVGAKPVVMIHPDDAEAVAETHTAMAAGLDRAVCTNRIRHRDGHWVWAEVKLQLVRDDTGTPNEILGTLRDITTRKLAELEAADAAARLMQANELLRRAEKIGQIGHWRLDLISNELLWSEEVYRIYGLPQSHRPTLATAIAAYHPDDRAIVATAVDESVNDAESFSLDVRLIRADGETRHVQSNGECDVDHRGRVVAVTGTFQDITERKIAEEERRQVEERLALVLQAADLATWRMDFVTGTREVNDKYLELADLTRDEFQPAFQTMWELLHPDDLAGMRTAVAALLANRGSFFEQEMRLRQKDGSWRWVLSRGAVVEWDRFGGPKIAYGTLLDISERRQMTDALAAARDLAEQANRTKSEFLAAMSHEIRTPMTGVIGFADLLLDSKLTAEQRRHTTMLKDAGGSLLAIINDILDVSKVEAGKLQLEHIPMSLASVADGALSLLRPQAASKGLDLSLHLAPDLPAWVLGDATRLRQILLNLLSNAVKFTDRGSISLSVTRQSGGDGDVARFDVCDTGIGIPDDKLDRLFQTFSQVDSSTSRRYGGTGLGLVISKHLAEAMGGVIGVASQPAVGSSFWFTIAFTETQAPKTVEAGSRNRKVRGARILVADDLPMNQIIVESLLRAEGHEVSVVANGNEAVQAVQDSDFDLILMDMQMPDMDGITATRVIRGLSERIRNIPIIALTANAMSEDVAACRAAGMNGHLSKPIDRDALLRIVEDWGGRGTPAMRKRGEKPALAAAVA